MLGWEQMDEELFERTIERIAVFDGRVEAKKKIVEQSA